MIFRLFVSVFLLLVSFQNAHAAKRVAVVIANSDYLHLPKLDKVLNDARLLRETLTTDLGFDVTYGENLDRRAMNQKINEVEAQVERGDIVFFYYAGHGVSLEGEDYLLPVDLQQAKAGEEKFVIGDSIGAGALTRKIQAKGARATFAVLDACRNNPLEMGLESGLDKIDVAKDVFVLFSAAHGKAALNTLSDSDQNPNSVFMRSLIPLLKTPGLTQIDLAKKVQEQVSTAAASTGHEQIPAYEDKFTDLITLNGGSGELVVEGQPPTDDQSLILEEWKIVKDSSNRAALEGFKSKYGSDPVWGPLVDQALSKLGAKPKVQAAEPKPVVREEPATSTLFRELQTELRRVGCYSGRIDGIWRLESRRALAQFARREGQSLKADENALDQLLVAESGICPGLSEKKKVTVAAPPRRVVKERRKLQKAAPPRRRPRIGIQRRNFGPADPNTREEQSSRGSSL